MSKATEILSTVKKQNCHNNQEIKYATDFVYYSQFEKTVTELCTEIEQLKKSNEWISVEDGLPEIGVLVQTKNTNDFNGQIYYDHDRIIMPEFEKMFESDQMIGSKVTHWKPII